jgi:hypothetical protein
VLGGMAIDRALKERRSQSVSNNSNFSWRARLRPIELGYVCGIAATIQLTYFSAAVVHEIYSYPPSGVTEFLLWVEESIAYWLQTMAVGFFVYLAYTVLFALVMALPAAVAISYMEIHKIRALWPHCLGAVLLWAVARAVYYLSSVFLKPMLDPKSADWLSLLGGDGVFGRLHPSISMTWESSALLVLITICQGSFAGWIYWLIAVKRAGLARQSPQSEIIKPT